MNKNIIPKILSVFCLLLLSLPFLFCTSTLWLMAFQSYNPTQGLFGSSFVGISNIQDFLHNTELLRMLKNTLNINIFTMVLGATYLFISMLAVNVFQNRFVRPIVTLIFVLPAIISPSAYLIMVQAIFSTETLINSSVLLQVIAAFVSALRFSSVFLIASLFTKEKSVPHAQKYTLLYIAFKLIHIFATDISFMQSFYNPLTYEHLDTYSTFQMRNGLMHSAFSNYAGGYVVQLLLQLFPALFGIFIIASPYRSKWTAKKSAVIDYQAYDTGNRVYLPCVLFAGIPLALFLLSWKTCGLGGLTLSQPDIQQAYTYSILIAGSSAVAVVVFGLFLAASCYHLNSIGIGFAAFLYFLSDTLLAPYIFGRTLGFLNTFMGPLIQNMHLILPMGIIAFCIMKEHRRKNLLPSLMIASLGLAFSWFWGDHLAPMITLSDIDKYPFSMLMYQSLNQPATGQTSGFLATNAALYIIVPVIVTGICFLISSLLLKKYE